MLLVLSIVAACAPAAPTPTQTPPPTATPVRVLATKPEHIAGTWFNPVGVGHGEGGLYYRFELDGTVMWDETLEGLDGTPLMAEEYWFEDGVYYEGGNYCVTIGSYRAYLDIEEGRAAALRFEMIDDSDQSCWERIRAMKARFVRVD
jgi:hypothetical protein